MLWLKSRTATRSHTFSTAACPLMLLWLGVGCDGQLFLDVAILSSLGQLALLVMMPHDSVRLPCLTLDFTWSVQSLGRSALDLRCLGSASGLKHGRSDAVLSGATRTSSWRAAPVCNLCLGMVRSNHGQVWAGSLGKFWLKQGAESACVLKEQGASWHEDVSIIIVTWHEDIIISSIIVTWHVPVGIAVGVGFSSSLLRCCVRACCRVGSKGKAGRGASRRVEGVVW